MPSCDGEMPSSSGAQSMPFETTPRISRGAERLGRARDASRPGRASGTRSPGRHVPDADDDLLLARAGLHAGEAERVAVRVVADLEHARDDDAGRGRSHGRSIDSTSAPLCVEQLGELLGGEVGRAELAQPRQDDLHAAPSNCSRNRTSPSTSSRMSSTP